MRTFVAAVALLCLLAACTEQQCSTCGRWKSNAERTLEEMERSTLLSEQQRAVFGESFFGKLIVETQPNVTRAFFPDQDPDTIAWTPWELLSQAGDSLTIRYLSDSGWLTRSVRVEGECYRVDQPELGFGEWFCQEP